MFRTHSTPPSVALSSHCSSVLLIALLTTTLAFAQIVEPPLISFPTFADVSGLSLTGVAARVGTVLRLTPAQTWDGSCAPRLAGNAWFSRRMPIAEGFETTFEFQITNLVNGGADGLAFVIHDAPTALLTVGGSCAGQGYFGIPRSLAVEFDTWLNPPTDFFMNLQGDPNANHVAVITRGQEPNHPSHAFALGTATNIRNLSDGNVHAARIIYTPGELSVFLDNLDAPALTVAVDLPATLGLVDGYAWVGFGAATGGAAETHDLVSWSLSIHRPGFPSVPEDLSAQLVAPTAIQLTWVDTLDNETRFVVERRRGVCGWEFLADTSANAQTYLDRLAPSGEELCYRVSAVGDLGASAPTDPACLTTPPAGRQQLMVYVGDPQDPNYDHWVGLTPCSKHFNSGYGTAVIVHGFQQERDDDQLGEWMLDTAKAISQRLRDPANVEGVNILAWDWQREAYGSLQQAINNINQQAGYLAESVKPFFGGGYAGPVHLMGHSMGVHVITVCAGHLTGNPLFTVNPRQVQLTYWDTPDRFLDSRQLDDNVIELRRRGVYVDSYAGITNLGTHYANLWVDVPFRDPWECPTAWHGHSVDNWYRCTIPENEDPPLYQTVCSDQVFPGTIGFGASVLLDEAKRRPESPPGPCRDVGTLKFGHVRCFLWNEFTFLGAENCQIFVPVEVVTGELTGGDYWLREDWQSNFGFINSTEMFFGAQAAGEGGGADVQDPGGPDVRYALNLVVDSEWDYLSFDYDFTQAVAPTILSVIITVGADVYPVFQMSSDLVLAEGYLNTGLRDIRQLHSQTVSITFELRSEQPGMVVYLRNLTFWQDPWHDNRPPVANAGGDQTIAVSPDGIGTVVLDGSASTDPDGDEPLEFWWLDQGDLVALGVTPTVQLPPGRHELTLQVRDPANAVGTDTVTVTVEVAYPFVRGDSNVDGGLDISDAINTLGYLFSSIGEVACQDAADSNDDGMLDISDAVFTLGFLFLSQPLSLPAPYPGRGPDLSPDLIGCGFYPP